MNNRNENEVREYFKNVIKCEYVPEEVVKYYMENDGLCAYVTEVFSLEQINDEFNKFFLLFLEGMGIDYNEYKYVPIANDGMGGYFAFLSNKDDKKIYYLDHEFPDELFEYEDFDEFFEEANYIPEEEDED